MTFADGGAADKTVRIPLMKDGKGEPNETVSLRLDDPVGGARLGSPATAVLTIMDSRDETRLRWRCRRAFVAGYLKPYA